jgi:predicted nucleic acid-binding protein
MASLSRRQVPRVMLDTTVLLAGTIWPRWPYAVLQHALQNDFRLVLAPVGLAEAYRKFQTRFPQHTPAFERFLNECRYETVANPTLEQVREHQNLMRDIHDVPLALAAILASVDYFVSDDKDFTAQTSQNAELHRQLKVLLPGTFLREVMGWSSEELERVRRRNWEELN